jgi:hypothetical protein
MIKINVAEKPRLAGPIPFARFDMNSWSACTGLEADFRPPPGMGVRVVLDPSWTANKQSDANALVCGYWEPPNDLGDNSFVLLDAESGVMAGRKLVHATLDFISKWDPFYFSIEVAAGRETKLLQDYIEDVAAQRGVKMPRTEMHAAGGTPWSKAKRVAKIQYTLDRGRLKVRKGAYLQKMADQARAFDFTRQDNGCHEDGLVDALSRCMGFN